MFNVDYVRPQTLPETLAFLSKNAADTTILAGGTDVMVDMRSGDLNCRYLLDVGRLTELRQIKFDSGELSIGAAVTITEIGQAEIIGCYAPALRKAADAVATPSGAPIVVLLDEKHFRFDAAGRVTIRYPVRE